MIEWVDIKERRPQDREVVLACYEYSGWTNQMGLAEYRDERFQFEGFGYAVTITHWTELNHPPSRLPE